MSWLKWNWSYEHLLLRKFVNRRENQAWSQTQLKQSQKINFASEHVDVSPTTICPVNDRDRRRRHRRRRRRRRRVVRDFDKKPRPIPPPLRFVFPEPSFKPRSLKIGLNQRLRSRANCYFLSFLLLLFLPQDSELQSLGAWAAQDWSSLNLVHYEYVPKSLYWKYLCPHLLRCLFRRKFS